MKKEINTWSASAKDQLQQPPGLPGAGGKGKGGSDGGGKGMDKKEIAVWNLPEELDKSAFRHWVDAVDVQLEKVHGLKWTSFVLNHVRRAKVAIDADVVSACIVSATIDISKTQQEMKVADGDDLDQPQDYPFQKCTTFLCAYLDSKLYIILFDKTVGIAHRNGFELYRQICQIIDVVPEHAQFHMRTDMTGFTLWIPTAIEEAHGRVQEGSC